ncbi:transporter [Pseudomonas aeruginosa]|nr:transporter [Pseudomonas aeruginosa]
MSLLRDAWRHAPTHHRVWALAGPMILSNVSVPLVHLVDSTVVGHLPHAYQLGAVAVGGSLYTLMVGVLGFLRMGTTGFAAQAAGRDDGGALRLILAQGLGMALLLALLLGALALPLSGWALQLMQPSAELTGEARAFFHTRLLGLPAALASYALVGWFLGTQNARAPLAILLTTNLSNIALVLWFVHGLDWGVQGAARASVLAEWSGALLGLALTRRDLARRPGRAQWQRLRHWLSWLPLLMVNRDIFIRSLALQLVFFLLTVQGTRLGDATVSRQRPAAQRPAPDVLRPRRSRPRGGGALRPRHRRPRPSRPAPRAGGSRWLVAAGKPGVRRAVRLVRPPVHRPAERHRRRPRSRLRLSAVPGLPAAAGDVELSARRPVHRRHPRPRDA